MVGPAVARESWFPKRQHSSSPGPGPSTREVGMRVMEEKERREERVIQPAVHRVIRMLTHAPAMAEKVERAVVAPERALEAKGARGSKEEPAAPGTQPAT